MEFFLWIQDSALGTWIRESDWAIFAILIIHTLSMAFLAGTAFTVVLRALGIAPNVSPALLVRFAPVMAIGLVVAILSGVLLVIGYPAKALTNPLFYVKLLLLVIAWRVTQSLLRRFVAAPLNTAAVNGAKAMAIASLVLWLTVIVAGKFLAYTNTMLLVY
jgi:hypothetical protein